MQQTEKKNKNIQFKKEALEPKQEWILLDTNPLLRNKCEPLLEITNEDNELINRMIAYVDACFNDEHEKYNLRPGIAVAAPQVGLLKRIIYVHFHDDDVEHQYLLVNPKIVAKSQAYAFIPGGEGCLSIPKDVKANIKRNYRVIVQAYDLLQNKDVEINANGILSICLQHEIDHLDGILYTDHINKDNPNYYEKEWVKID